MSPAGLARFVSAAPVARPDDPGELCELCGAPVPDAHAHVVDLESRALLCACRACSLLFSNPGAGAGRLRLVPQRILYDPGFELRAGDWDELQIPVGLAFFFKNSALGRWAAFYPSPGGATESVLSLSGWEAVLENNQALAAPEPDVEAVLIRRSGPVAGGYLVPIDVCYQLVGLVRMHWKGFDGGADVHDRIERFLAELVARSERVRRA